MATTTPAAVSSSPRSDAAPRAGTRRVCSRTFHGHASAPGLVRQRALHHARPRGAEDESRLLLTELFAYSTRDEFVYRHRWQPGDMVFWDNRSLVHLAGGSPDRLRRRLDRTTIEGDVPF